jgi:hypothetical protein
MWRSLNRKTEDIDRDSISEEIRKVERRLREAIGEAYRQSIRDGETSTGSVHIGYFSTHLRCTMILCDEDWGWLTITLPPARAPQTPSFELSNRGRHTLLEACWRHFNRTWTIAAERKEVKDISRHN